MQKKRKSSMAAVDSALAKQKEDFDKAVNAEVEIRMAGIGTKEKERWTIHPLNEPILQPVGMFSTKTSELMGKITDLRIVVEEIINAIKPVTVPNMENKAPTPTETLEPVQSEFVEFIECAGRRIDALKEKIADTMTRIQL